MTTRLQLFKELAASELKKHLPVRPQWFSEQALATGTLGKFVTAVAEQVAGLRDAISVTREGLVLTKATGEFLDAWGEDLDLARLPGEADDPYRARLLGVLGVDHTTEVGLRSHVEATTGLETSLFIPWKSQQWYGKRTPGTQGKDPMFGYSTQARYPSPYIRAYVVDVTTKGYSPLTEPTATAAVAAGVKVFFSTLQECEPGVSAALLEQLLTSDFSYEYRLRTHRPLILSHVIPWGGGKVGSYDRFVTSDVSAEVDCWNTLDLRCQVAFASFPQVSWAQALVGPLEAHPNADVRVMSN